MIELNRFADGVLDTPFSYDSKNRIYFRKYLKRAIEQGNGPVWSAMQKIADKARETSGVTLRPRWNDKASAEIAEIVKSAITYMVSCELNAVPA